jgi:hypothetical protein
VIALLVGSLLVGATACCLAALLRPRGRVAFVLGAAIVAFAEVVALSHALSFFDAYERRWLLGATVVVALGAAVAVRIVRPPWPSFRLGAAVRDVLRDPIVAILAVVVAVELAYLSALAIVTPPSETDTVTYHLTRAALWIQQQSVWPVRDVGDTRIDEFPPDAEILQAWTMVLSGSVRYAQLVSFGALLVSMLSIYGIAARIGLGRRSAAFGALLFATLPIVALQAPTALTDLPVAALVVAAACFTLGRTPGELALACIAVALLVGTKTTGLLSLPLLLAVALLALHGRRLVLALAGGLAACAVGAAWYLVNVSGGDGALGAVGEGALGTGQGVTPVLGRITRYAVAAVELPGAGGEDALLYVVAAAAVAVVGVLVSHPAVAVAGAALTVLALAALPLEDALHRVYWRGWELLGEHRIARYAAGHEPTVASSATSWYGPVGVTLALVALVLVVRGARRSTLPWVAVVLVCAPVVLLVGSSVAVGFHEGNGRYLMAGVALSAATWGVVRPYRPGAAAVVAVAATTTLLSLVNYHEKPAGIGLLEDPVGASIWTLPAEWAQNVQPELVPVTRYVRERAQPGETIALARSTFVRPFLYVGWPGVDHPLEFADTLAEARRKDAAWALLPDDAECEGGWRLAVHSPPWVLYRQVPGAACR